LQEVSIEGNKIVAAFDQQLLTNNNKPAGFEIGYKVPGNNSLIFVKAEAKIEDNKAIVWSDKVDKPVMVRYSWLIVEEANLVNKIGLPAHPFRMRLR